MDNATAISGGDMILSTGLSYFHPLQHTFVLVSPGVVQRIKVYDVQLASLKQEYQSAENDLLNYISLAYPSSITLSDESNTRNSKRRKTKKTAKKKSVNNDEIKNDIFALGSQRGIIDIWSLSVGEKVARLGGNTNDNSNTTFIGHISSITDLLFSPISSNILYSCDSDRKVFSWDINTRSIIKQYLLPNDFEHGTSSLIRMAISPDGTLLVIACSSIVIFNIDSGNVLRQFVGHGSPVTALTFSPDGKLLASGADHDRFICCWDINDCNNQDDSNNTNKLPLLQTFTMEAGFPSYLLFGSENPAFLMAIDADGSSISLWEYDDTLTLSLHTSKKKKTSKKSKSKKNKKESENNKNIHPVPTKLLIRSFPSDTVSVKPNIIMAKFSNSQSHILQIARTTGSFPFFDDVDLEAGKETKVLELPVVSPHLLLPSQSDTQAKGRKKRKARDSIQPTILGPEETSAVSSSLPILKRNKTQSSKGEAVLLDQSTLPFQERLALASTPSSLTQHQDKHQHPKADSLISVLHQAIQSKDLALMEFVLSQTSHTLIIRTVERLEAPSIVPLVHYITKQFQGNPARASHLLPWLKALLLQHTSYIMSVPSLSSSLSSLYHTIEKRLSLLPNFLRVAGRVNLLLFNAKKMKQDKEGELIQPKPLMVYKEAEEEAKKSVDNNESEVEDMGDIDDISDDE